MFRTFGSTRTEPVPLSDEVRTKPWFCLLMAIKLAEMWLLTYDSTDLCKTESLRCLGPEDSYIKQCTVGLST